MIGILCEQSTQSDLHQGFDHSPRGSEEVRLRLLMPWPGEDQRNLCPDELRRLSKVSWGIDKDNPHVQNDFELLWIQHFVWDEGEDCLLTRLFKEELPAASYSPIASAIHLQLRCRIASLMDTLTTKPQMLLDVPWAWKVTRKQSLLWYSKILEESWHHRGCRIPLLKLMWFPIS